MFALGTPAARGQDPSRIASACNQERLRQWRELILIPSESICFPEAAEVLASDFGNIYAEGQPALRLSRNPEALSQDPNLLQAWHRRLSDGRFYRGCAGADQVELLAKQEIAKAFSLLPGSPAARRIQVNVQALSGAPANLGVYTALLKEGDALLGLHLSHGGHLSHGSPFNISGRHYRAFSYGIDEQAKGEARRLDYGRIRELARRHRPRMIVGGSSAYPWDWDWAALRAIADEVGALLLADIAHLAGMVVAGLLNNPLPYAHVVTFTTHKTLCGPRGAAIVSSCPETARAIDLAVFPGLQGGPHLNTIAAIGRLFELIRTQRDSFIALQSRIIRNAKILSNALRDEGFTLEYGGTATHLLLLDLKPFQAVGSQPLDGETASRLLENVGIICNKNTLPGDKDASESSGLRFGTPWVTQRGIGTEQLKTLAGLIRRVLGRTHVCTVYVPSGEERCRGRLPFEVLQEARHQVLALSETLPYPPRPPQPLPPEPVLYGQRVGILVRGEKANLALEAAFTQPVVALAVGQLSHGLLLKPDGAVLDDAAVIALGRHENPACGPNGEYRYAIFPHAERAAAVQAWLEALSDGYVLLRPDDPQMKVDGPLVLEPLQQGMVAAQLLQRVKALPEIPSPREAPAGAIAREKTFFVGQAALQAHLAAEPKPAFAWQPPEGPLKKTLLHDWHARAGAKLVPFGGWEMPVEYPTGIFREHAAVRSAAGLFDVSHMSALEVKGPQALPFLETVFANCVSRLVDNEAQYSYMLLPDGTALDDLYVYRIAWDKFMVVVNASNTDRDLAWLKAVNAGEVCLDLENPGKRAPGPVELRALREAGRESRIDLAFQGPLSIPILEELVASEEERLRIRESRLNDILWLTLKGIPVLAARTGYTGEEVGFELFVHPDRGVELWELLLAQGKDRGVLPCGLGARDSLRIEAGFPLFGHELEGPEALTLTEAGYGFVSRYHVPFYVGRQEYMRRLARKARRVIRLRGTGRRSIRAGQLILDGQGMVAGVVTSFAFCNPRFDFQVLACVRPEFRPAPGTRVRAYRAEAGQMDGEIDERKVVELEALPRFPTPQDKSGWRELYKHT